MRFFHSDHGLDQLGIYVRRETRRGRGGVLRRHLIFNTLLSAQTGRKGEGGRDYLICSKNSGAPEMGRG